MDLFDDLRRRRGLGILLITHDLGLVADRARRLVVMHAGRVCEAGLAAAVLEHPVHPYTRGLLSCRLPADSRIDPLGRLEDVLEAPGAWEPCQTEIGPLKPWWPQAGVEGRSGPRLVAVGVDHLVAVDPGSPSFSH